MKQMLPILLILTGSLLYGQGKGMINGTVRDAVNGEPMVAVNISADRKSGTSSDLNGEYSLELEAGRHVIEFYFPSQFFYCNGIFSFYNSRITIH